MLAFSGVLIEWTFARKMADMKHWDKGQHDDDIP
jgi:hypothetical protein